MIDKTENNNKNPERHYLGVMLIFAAVQVMISILQFIQSSVNSETGFGKYFGLVGVFALAIIMWYMYKIVKDDK